MSQHNCLDCGWAHAYPTGVDCTFTLQKPGQVSETLCLEVIAWLNDLPGDEPLLLWTEIEVGKNCPGWKPGAPSA